MNKTRLKCIICLEFVSLHEQVDIDIMHSVTHHDCNTERPVKDSGRFKDISIKYPYFEPFLQHE